MDSAADEAEHSLELHLPYIVHVMRGHPFSLVPIVVGAVSGEAGGRCLRGRACSAQAAQRRREPEQPGGLGQLHKPCWKL